MDRTDKWTELTNCRISTQAPPNWAALFSDPNQCYWLLLLTLKSHSHLSFSSNLEIKVEKISLEVAVVQPRSDY
jgi:hypothetical protein